MTDPIHDLLTAEGERWRHGLGPDPSLAELLDTSTGVESNKGVHRGRAWRAAGPRVAASLLVAAGAVTALTLWLTGMFAGSSPHPLAGGSAGSTASSPPGTSVHPAFSPPFTLTLVGARPGQGEEATVARGTVGKPVRITVTIHVVGHRPGRIMSLDLIVGTPNAEPGSGSGPAMGPDFVGKRSNQIAARRFHPGSPADGQQITATVVVPAAGRYPIDVQMAVAYRDPSGDLTHLSTGEQLGYLMISPAAGNPGGSTGAQTSCVAPVLSTTRGAAATGPGDKPFLGQVSPGQRVTIYGRWYFSGPCQDTNASGQTPSAAPAGPVPLWLTTSDGQTRLLATEHPDSGGAFTAQLTVPSDAQTGPATISDGQGHQIDLVITAG